MGERLEDVFQDEILKAFTDITGFKMFARSERGLHLAEHVIQDIVEDHKNNVVEQKLTMLNMWKEKYGEKATGRFIRNLVANYKRGDDEEDYVSLGDGMFGLYRNQPLCDRANVYFGVQKSEITGSYFCAIKLQKKNKHNLREAQILSKLRNHVNVVSILHAGIYRAGLFDYIYIAMDLSWTKTVRNMLEECDKLGIPFNEFIATSLVRQISKAVDFIHSNNIIHRDLKPENVLLSEDWSQSKVTDFEFSKTVALGFSTKQTNENIGTDGYRCAETYNKDVKITLKSDMFSVGVIIAEILANGRHPFGKDQYLWSHNIINNKDFDLSHLLVSNKSQVIGLIKRMLDMDPKKRPTAEEVLNEIQQFKTWSQLMDQQTTADQSSATESRAQQQNLPAEKVLNETQQFPALSKLKNQQTVADQSPVTKSRAHQQSSTAEKVLIETQLFQSSSELKNQQTVADQSSVTESRAQQQSSTSEEVLNETQQFQASSELKNQQSTADQSSVTESTAQQQSSTDEEGLNKTQQFQALSELKSQQTIADQSSATTSMAELSNTEKANTIIVFNWKDKHIHSFNLTTQEWSKMQKLPRKYIGSTDVVSGKHIYVLKKQKMYQLEYSDPASKWKKMSSMINDHGVFPSAVLLNGFIYVCGGEDASLSVERYDAARDEWQLVCDMNNRRQYTCVAATHDIYCIGGSDDVSVERYDEGSNQWRLVEAAPRVVENASAAVVNNRIYVADDKGVLCYDIQKNSWNEMNLSPSPRQWPFEKVWTVKIISVNEELYIMSAKIKGSDFKYAAIHMLDPDTEQMTLVKEGEGKNFTFLINSCLAI